MADVSALGAFGGPRLETFVVGGVQYGLNERWSLTARTGLMVDSALGPRLRDSTVQGQLLVVDEAQLVVRVRPGLSLPTGTAPQGLGTLPGSSRSVDPRVGGDLVFGGAWLGSVSVDARVPLYEGPDRVRQGSFYSVGARGARRVSDRAVPWVGVSYVGSTADSRGSGAFQELSVVAGSVVNLDEHWSLNAQLRVPVYSSGGGLPYAVAAGVGVARVFQLQEQAHAPH